MPNPLQAELQKLWAAIDKDRKEIRRLRTWQQRVGSGSGLRAGGSVTGNVSTMVNNNASALAQGDVVVIDGAQGVDKTTVVGTPAVAGVADEAIAAAGFGKVRHGGYQAVVKVQGAVAEWDYLRTSATSGRAEAAGSSASTSPVKGAFGIATSAFAGPGAGTVSAFLFDAQPLDDAFGVGLTIGDGVNPMATGIILDFEVPYDLTIEGWTLVADVAGSIVIDLWVDTFANFPPTVADTITGSEKPTLAAAQTAQDLALTTWTVDLNKGDWCRVNIDSAATLQRVTLALRWKKR